MTEPADHGNCDDALHQLYIFLDGELTPERRARIEVHLNGCNPCLEAFDFHAELRMVIAKKCQDEVPPALLARIGELIGQPISPSAGP